MYRYEVRFTLIRGQNYMTLQVKDKYKGSVINLPPEEVQLRLTNCKLVNRANQARKIYEGANKQVVAWISCASYEVLTKPVPCTSPVLYNPRLAPNWRDLEGRNLDGQIYKQLTSVGRVFYAQG